MHSRIFKANLTSGNYRYYVYAKDKAGNRQRNVASNSIKIILAPTPLPAPEKPPTPHPRFPVFR
ncbi:MAG: hypothetical protein E3J54_00730 [Actinobacteria bacterium]|nr:MAG: hypothetical protein E3J54_00730 [Actinomycetota bacterium]